MRYMIYKYFLPFHGLPFHSVFVSKIYLFIFRERGRAGEKYQCVVASHMPPSTGDLACSPGVCPGWESNWQPFGSQARTEYTELYQTWLYSINSVFFDTQKCLILVKSSLYFTFVACAF